MKKNLLFTLCGILISHYASSQNLTTIPLSSLEAFKDVGKNWSIASDVTMSLNQSSAKQKSGQGVLVNTINKDNNSNLVTKEEFGDIELRLDFMMAKGSNSGVYLQGRYEIQLADSWTQLDPTFADCGGVYERWDDSRSGSKGFEGIPPLANASLAPGLWQSLVIRFRAPKFNEQGEKTSNAVFEEVYLNGVLVQQQVQVTGPTRASLFNDEIAKGPIVLQGDHGNVAFRNIQYRALPAQTTANTGRRFRPSLSPILINPSTEPYLVRSYLNFKGNKRTHVISVGNPDQTNFSYDLKQGALFQFWRGNFVDATMMWESRGEPQTVQPLGAVISLSSAPSFAILSNQDAAWPDSIPFNDLHNKGYSLDKRKNPTFQYEYAGFSVADKISQSENGESLNRQIKVSEAPQQLYFRVARGKVIESLGKGLYAIDGKSYYIKIDKRVKPILRTSQGGEELIIPFDKSRSTLDYSIIW